MKTKKITSVRAERPGLFITIPVLFHKAVNLLVILLLCGMTACGDSEPGSDGTDTGQYIQQAAPAEAASRGTIEEARAMLDRAVAHYMDVGREQALSDFTAKKEPFIDRDLYVFCYGPDRTISGHGADPGLLGVPVDELRDVDDFSFGTRIMEVGEESPDGGYVEYKWLNPVTGEMEPKISIVRLIGTDICGVGAYSEPG